jgi:hypothetical protein
MSHRVFGGSPLLYRQHQGTPQDVGVIPTAVNAQLCKQGGVTRLKGEPQGTGHFVGPIVKAIVCDADGMFLFGVVAQM